MNRKIIEKSKRRILLLSKFMKIKNLLFNVWENINNNTYNEDFATKLKISDLNYVINFAYNEMSKKMRDDNLESS